MLWHPYELDRVNWPNKPLHAKLTCYRNTTANQTDLHQGLSGLANGNGHGFWITDTHITRVTSWNARTPFASGQTELVAEKLRKLFSLAAIQETDWLGTG